MAKNTTTRQTAQEGTPGGGKGAAPAKPANDATDATKQLTDDQDERDQVRTGLKGDEVLRPAKKAGEAKGTDAGNKQADRSAK